MINKKLLIISAVVVLTISIVSVFVWVVSSYKQQGDMINLQVAPMDAQIILDSNIPIKTGKQRVAPGKHSLYIYREGFKGLQTSFTTKKGEETTVPIGLEAISFVGRQYQEDHAEEFINVQNLTSAQYTIDSKKLSTEYPIISELPQVYLPNYRLDYGVSIKYPNDSTKIAIYISANSSFYRQVGLFAIYGMGYDPSDYEIIFEPLIL